MKISHTLNSLRLRGERFFYLQTKVFSDSKLRLKYQVATLRTSRKDNRHFGLGWPSPCFNCLREIITFEKNNLLARVSFGQLFLINHFWAQKWLN